MKPTCTHQARLAQSAERKALNLVVVGSSPTVGVSCMLSVVVVVVCVGGGGEGLTNLDVDLNVMLLTPVKPRGCMGINTAETDGASNCPASIRPRGVTVSTLDSESSDRGSNSREAFCTATRGGRGCLASITRSSRQAPLRFLRLASQPLG